MSYMFGKFLANIVLIVEEYFVKAVGLLFLGVGIIALAVVFPLILILYCLIVGTYLFKRS